VRPATLKERLPSVARAALVHGLAALLAVGPGAGRALAEPEATAHPELGRIERGDVQLENLAPPLERPDLAGLTRIEATNGSIADYRSFDIGRDWRVEVEIDPGTRGGPGSHLARVDSGDPTQIAGELWSNGHVYIANPAGVIWSGDARVDVVGLHAAAGDVNTSAFTTAATVRGERIGLATNDAVSGVSGKLEVGPDVRIHASDVVQLIGRQVLSRGSIVTGQGGAVVMVAGEDVVITTSGGPESADRAIRVTIRGIADRVRQALVDQTAIEQRGSIDALDGRVVLAAGDLYGTAIDFGGRTAQRTEEVRLEAQAGAVALEGELTAREVTLCAASDCVLGNATLAQDAVPGQLRIGENAVLAGSPGFDVTGARPPVERLRVDQQAALTVDDRLASVVQDAVRLEISGRDELVVANELRAGTMLLESQGDLDVRADLRATGELLAEAPSTAARDLPFTLSPPSGPFELELRAGGDLSIGEATAPATLRADAVRLSAGDGAPEIAPGQGQPAPAEETVALEGARIEARSLEVEQDGSLGPIGESTRGVTERLSLATRFGSLTVDAALAGELSDADRDLALRSGGGLRVEGDLAARALDLHAGSRGSGNLEIGTAAGAPVRLDAEALALRAGAGQEDGGARVQLAESARIGQGSRLERLVIDQDAAVSGASLPTDTQAGSLSGRAVALRSKGGTLTLDKDSAARLEDTRLALATGRTTGRSNVDVNGDLEVASLEVFGSAAFAGDVRAAGDASFEARVDLDATAPAQGSAQAPPVDQEITAGGRLFAGGSVDKLTAGNLRLSGAELDLDGQATSAVVSGGNLELESRDAAARVAGDLLVQARTIPSSRSGGSPTFEGGSLALRSDLILDGSPFGALGQPTEPTNAAPVTQRLRAQVLEIAPERTVTLERGGTLSLDGADSVSIQGSVIAEAGERFVEDEQENQSVDRVNGTIRVTAPSRIEVGTTPGSRARLEADAVALGGAVPAGPKELLVGSADLRADSIALFAATSVPGEGRVEIRDEARFDRTQERDAPEDGPAQRVLVAQGASLDLASVAPEAATQLAALDRGERVLLRLESVGGQAKLDPALAARLSDARVDLEVAARDDISLTGAQLEGRSVELDAGQDGSGDLLVGLERGASGLADAAGAPLLRAGSIGLNAGDGTVAGPRVRISDDARFELVPLVPGELPSFSVSQDAPIESAGSAVGSRSTPGAGQLVAPGDALAARFAARGSRVTLDPTLAGELSGEARELEFVSTREVDVRLEGGALTAKELALRAGVGSFAGNLNLLGQGTLAADEIELDAGSGFGSVAAVALGDARFADAGNTRAPDRLRIRQDAEIVDGGGAPSSPVPDGGRFVGGDASGMRLQLESQGTAGRIELRDRAKLSDTHLELATSGGARIALGSRENLEVRSFRSVTGSGETSLEGHGVTATEGDIEVPGTLIVAAPSSQQLIGDSPDEQPAVASVAAEQGSIRAGSVLGQFLGELRVEAPDGEVVLEGDATDVALDLLAPDRLVADGKKERMPARLLVSARSVDLRAVDVDAAGGEIGLDAAEKLTLRGDVRFRRGELLASGGSEGIELAPESGRLAIEVGSATFASPVRQRREDSESEEAVTLRVDAVRRPVAEGEADAIDDAQGTIRFQGDLDVHTIEARGAGDVSFSGEVRADTLRAQGGTDGAGTLRLETEAIRARDVELRAGAPGEVATGPAPERVEIGPARFLGRDSDADLPDRFVVREEAGLDAARIEELLARLGPEGTPIGAQALSGRTIGLVSEEGDLDLSGDLDRFADSNLILGASEGVRVDRSLRVRSLELESDGEVQGDLGARRELRLGGDLAVQGDVAVAGNTVFDADSDQRLDAGGRLRLGDLGKEPTLGGGARPGDVAISGAGGIEISGEVRLGEGAFSVESDARLLGDAQAGRLLLAGRPGAAVPRVELGTRDQTLRATNGDVTLGNPIDKVRGDLSIVADRRVTEGSGDQAVTRIEPGRVTVHGTQDGRSIEVRDGSLTLDANYRVEGSIGAEDRVRLLGAGQFEGRRESFEVESRQGAVELRGGVLGPRGLELSARQGFVLGGNFGGALDLTGTPSPLEELVLRPTGAPGSVIRIEDDTQIVASQMALPIDVVGDSSLRLDTGGPGRISVQGNVTLDGAAVLTLDSVSEQGVVFEKADGSPTSIRSGSVMLSPGTRAKPASATLGSANDLRIEATRASVEMGRGQVLTVQGDLDVTAKQSAVLADVNALGLSVKAPQIVLLGRGRAPAGAGASGLDLGTDLVANRVDLRGDVRVSGGAATVATPTASEISDQTLASERVLARAIRPDGSALRAEDLVDDEGRYLDLTPTGPTLRALARDLVVQTDEIATEPRFALALQAQLAAAARPLWAQELLLYLEQASLSGTGVASIKTSDPRFESPPVQRALEVYRGLFAPTLRVEPQTGERLVRSHHDRVRAAIERAALECAADRDSGDAFAACIAADPARSEALFYLRTLRELGVLAAEAGVSGGELTEFMERLLAPLRPSALREDVFLDAVRRSAPAEQ
jgi:filamentous hemagglutinin family protein